ncbi:IS66 family transposase [Aquisphaera giovannonii]|nr:IS66 family transposase [Aquisphaera giovannonii]
MSDAPLIPIPDDPEECRRLLLESLRRIGELERVLDATAADYGDLQRRYAEQAESLALLRRYLFGPRRERVADDPGQGHLFGLGDAAIERDSLDAPEPDGPAAGEPATKAPRRPRPSRPRASLDHLPHVRIEHDLPEAEKSCPCFGGMKRRIGEDTSRELEFIPAKLEVRVHVLPKYACPRCKGGVAAPPVPTKPVPGGIAGAGLVSFVLVSKFADHLPLYRLEDILFRHGVALSRGTLCDWVRNAADLLRPLADLQRERVLGTDLIWTDDTFVTALGGDRPGSTKAWFWAYIGGAEAPYAVYDFTMSRERDGPATFLKGYRGYLQADAYGGYDGIYAGSDGAIAEVACWAHARRKFFEARSNAPAEANRILEWVRRLYDIEDRGRELAAEDRRSLRRRESVPILDRIEAYVDELRPRALPKSALGKALTYARNQRAALRRYVEDGRLTIDNNASERVLRLQAIGRKNWLFLGSEAAGPRAAVLFTILAGAKRHRLEPWAYLREVLLHLAAGEADLESLLPDRWAAAHPEHVLEHRLEESRQRAARQKAIRDRRRAGRPRRD